MCDVGKDVLAPVEMPGINDPAIRATKATAIIMLIDLFMANIPLDWTELTL
jgi:hypothetical protein